MRVNRPIFLVLAVVSAGCGAHRALDADGSPRPSSVDGGDVDAVDGDDGDAVCASPAACNDDPKMSAIAGTCRPFADSWYCECADGFSVNPRTSLCRAGTACVAAAADSWDFRLPFDTRDCASRTSTECTTVGWTLGSLMGTACALPVLLTIRIELADGCPTLFEARAASPMMLGDFDQPFLACFTAILANLRLGCSTGADCFTATNEPPGPIP